MQRLFHRPGWIDVIAATRCSELWGFQSLEDQGRATQLVVYSLRRMVLRHMRNLHRLPWPYSCVSALARRSAMAVAACALARSNAISIGNLSAQSYRRQSEFTTGRSPG